MKNLSNQEQKVYDYLKENPGATTHDITRDTFVQKPCARIVGLKEKGVEIEIVGEVKYPGTHAFKKYAIAKPLTKKQQQVTIVDGVAKITYAEVAI